MAFGITRAELAQWKTDVTEGRIAFITHYWLDDRFPDAKTVTKVGCKDLDKLATWGQQYGLKREWIDQRNDYPHFDLFGEHEVRILKEEGYVDQLKRFSLQ